jgi:hypothetical protein
LSAALLREEKETKREGERTLREGERRRGGVEGSATNAITIAAKPRPTIPRGVPMPRQGEREGEKMVRELAGALLRASTLRDKRLPWVGKRKQRNWKSRGRAEIWDRFSDEPGWLKENS